MRNRKVRILLLGAVALLLAACSPKIYGTVQLVDPEMNPLEGESPQGTVINMINTTAKVEDVEVIDGDGDASKIKIQLVQFDEAAWDDFRNIYANRQIEVEELLAAMKGY